MLDKPDSTHTLGLELVTSKLRGVELSFLKGQPKLEQIFEIPLSHSETNDTINEHVNPLYITEDGKRLIGALEKNLIVSALSTNEVLIRSLELKLKKEKDIDAVLAFQAEPMLPYPIENALIDRTLLSQNSEGSLLTLFAARKDHVQQHLHKWAALQIEPEVISCTPAVLTSFANLFSPNEKPFFVVNLGYSQTACLVINQGKLIAAQSCHGLSHLQQAFLKDEGGHPALEEKFEELDFSTLANYPNLLEAFSSMRLEIHRILFALAKQSKQADVQDLLMVGDGALLTNFFPSLLSSTKMNLKEPTPTPAFPLTAAQLQKYAIPIGAALSALPTSKDQINFRQNEFVYPHPWKRYKQPIAIYLALCLFVAAAFYLFGESYLKYQEDDIRQQYATLLAGVNKPYKEFEIEYQKKNPTEANQEDEQVMGIMNLSPAEIENRVLYLEKELKSAPDMYPLLPNTPRVSDVLAWLSTHTNVVGKDEKTEALLPIIQLENFSYVMVKRPDQTKKQEKYQVKVEIEFTSPTPKQAREFHDALIAPNPLVDPKGEVKWTANKGKYRASFFLKDKTVYPTGK
jgi:type IV pilus assembly protein PilM